MQTKNLTHVKYVTGVSIFAALAYIVALVCNVIPPVAGFLSLDVKDAVISIAAFVYGPVAGVIIALIAALVELLTFSTTAWYGFVMNFASSAVFALTASLIYKFRRTINGALAGYFVAVVATTGVMLILNRFVTPIYLIKIVGVPEVGATATVLELLPGTLLPFNLAKSLLNASVALLLYKPVITALRRTGMVRGSKSGVGMSFNRNSVIILSTGIVALAAAIILLILVW